MRRAAAGAAVVLGALAGPGGAAMERDLVASAVVGIVVTHQGWNQDQPWARTNPGSRRASAVVVEGPYLLTTAQMVSEATLIQLEKFGRPARAVPRVVLEDRELNLALLAVDEPGFFDDLAPVTVATETPVDGTLRTVRWQDQQFESAASRVKRFRVEESWFGSLEHVFLQVQTDMTAGGWAEPVFAGERLVGLTVSQQRDQRARAIPAEILTRFLARARDPGGYRPFPVFGAKWQANRDRALAAFLGQTGEPRGVVVRQVPWGSSACGTLAPRDILLAVDGVALDADGFYSHPRLGQLAFAQILVERHAAGDTIPVRVLRQGVELELRMTLRTYPVGIEKIPERLGGAPPPYVVAGGLVFRELDVEYLRSWGNDWLEKAPLWLLSKYLLDQEGQRPGARRIVILAAVLPSAYNVGYQDLRDLAVERVNGRTVAAIEDLAAALLQPADGFHTIVLEPNGSRREIVLDAAGLKTATAAALAAYGIPAASRMPVDGVPDAGPSCPHAF
jgi:hypothetical protein